MFTADSRLGDDIARGRRRGAVDTHHQQSKAPVGLSSGSAAALERDSQGTTATSITGQLPRISRLLERHQAWEISTACPGRIARYVPVAPSRLRATLIRTDGRELRGSGKTGTSWFPEAPACSSSM